MTRQSHKECDRTVLMYENFPFISTGMVRLCLLPRMCAADASGNFWRIFLLKLVAACQWKLKGYRQGLSAKRLEVIEKVDSIPVQNPFHHSSQRGQLAYVNGVKNLFIEFVFIKMKYR